MATAPTAYNLTLGDTTSQIFPSTTSKTGWADANGNPVDPTGGTINGAPASSVNPQSAGITSLTPAAPTTKSVTFYGNDDSGPGITMDIPVGDVNYKSDLSSYTTAPGVYNVVQDVNRLSGNQLSYIYDAVNSGSYKIDGNTLYTGSGNAYNITPTSTPGLGYIRVGAGSDTGFALPIAYSAKTGLASMPLDMVTKGTQYIPGQGGGFFGGLVSGISDIASSLGPIGNIALATVLGPEAGFLTQAGSQTALNLVKGQNLEQALTGGVVGAGLASGIGALTGGAAGGADTSGFQGIDMSGGAAGAPATDSFASPVTSSVISNAPSGGISDLQPSTAAAPSAASGVAPLDQAAINPFAQNPAGPGVTPSTPITNAAQVIQDASSPTGYTYMGQPYNPSPEQIGNLAQPTTSATLNQAVIDSMYGTPGYGYNAAAAQAASDLGSNAALVGAGAGIGAAAGGAGAAGAAGAGAAAAGAAGASTGIIPAIAAATGLPEGLVTGLAAALGLSAAGKLLSPSQASTGGGGPSQTPVGSALSSAYQPLRYKPYAAGGITNLAPMATGGISSLGGYSDGGRLLRGPGDGVSDDIPATIGNKQPARLADGEFVVPARIVSELGNGSTDAGARKLYQMMDKVQQSRRRTMGKNFAKDTKTDKFLPT